MDKTSRSSNIGMMYMFIGFFCHEKSISGEKIWKNLIFWAQGAHLRPIFYKFHDFLPPASEQSHSLNLKANNSGFLTIKIQILKDFFFNLIFWATGAHLRPFFTIFSYFLP